MKAQRQEHPDLLAFAEGRLDEKAHGRAERHVSSCERCRQDLSQLEVVLEHLNKVITRVKDSCHDPEKLAKVVDAAFDPAEAEFVLQRSDMIYTLSKALQKRLVAKPSLARRLGEAVQSLTGMGKDAAGQLSDRILAGSQKPMGAPAVRKDATEVEDETVAPGPEAAKEPEKDQ